MAYYSLCSDIVLSMWVLSAKIIGFRTNRTDIAGFRFRRNRSVKLGGGTLGGRSQNHPRRTQREDVVFETASFIPDVASTLSGDVGNRREPSTALIEVNLERKGTLNVDGFELSTPLSVWPVTSKRTAVRTSNPPAMQGWTYWVKICQTKLWSSWWSVFSKIFALLKICNRGKTMILACLIDGVLATYV